VERWSEGGWVPCHKSLHFPGSQNVRFVALAVDVLVNTHPPIQSFSPLDTTDVLSFYVGLKREICFKSEGVHFSSVHQSSVLVTYTTVTAL
jgi:hypothetical protein